MQPVPSGCNNSVPYSFELSVIDTTTRAFGCSFRLQASGFTLSNGILKGRQSKVVYVDSDSRLYFGSPFRFNTALDAGFSICSNASLAYGDSTVFYKCFSEGSFGIFNEPSGILCSPIFIDVVGTPISLTSPTLATVTKVTIPVGSKAISSGSSLSEPTDTPVSADMIEFDFGTFEDALLVERSKKTQLRHHLAITMEESSHAHNTHLCETGRKNHRCRFRSNKNYACNHGMCKHGHSIDDILVAPSSLATEETISNQEPVMNDNQRRHLTPTSFPMPSSSNTEYVFVKVRQSVFPSLSSYLFTPKSFPFSPATTIITMQSSTVLATEPTSSIDLYQSA